MQGMGFLFDGLENAPDNFCAFRPGNPQVFEPRAPYRIEAHSFRRNGKPVFAFWTPEHVEISAPTVRGTIYMQMDESEIPEHPIVIDPIRRNVWLLDPGLLNITSDSGNFHGSLFLRNFPVTDCPLLVADASLFE